MAHVARLSETLSNMRVTDLGDATSALVAIQDSVFSDEDKTRMQSIVASLVSSAPAVATAKSVLRQQEHVFFENYLTKSDWAVLSSTTAAKCDKIAVVVARSISIGLLSMTERTAQSIACILLAACSMCDPSAAAAHNTLMDLKAAFKKARNTRPADHRPTLEKFPEKAADFAMRFPNKYTPDDMPIACPIDPIVLMNLRSNIACRKTHTTLRCTPAAASSSQMLPATMQNMFGMMMPFLQAFNKCTTTPQKRARIQLLTGGNNTGGDNSPAHSHRFLPASPAIGPSSMDEDLSTDDASIDTNAFVQLALPAPPAAVLPAPPPVPPRAPAASPLAFAASEIQAAIAAKAAEGKKAKATSKREAKLALTDAKCKAKAKAKHAKCKAAPKAKLAKATSGGSKTAAKKMTTPGGKPLGCGKCRGCHTGCSQCQSDDFEGKRWKR